MKKISDQVYNKAVELFNAGLSIRQIEKELGISQKSISSKLKSLGYEIKSNKPTIDYKSASELYKNSNITLSIFCKENNISLKWFREYLVKNNITYLTSNHNETKFDENIFDEINTEEKAY